MGSCYSADHTAEDHIHTDITCNIEEPQQKYCPGTVSNRLRVGGGGGGGGGLNTFYWIQNSPSASAIVQPNQTSTINSTDQHKLFNIYFYLFFYFSLHKT